MSVAKNRGDRSEIRLATPEDISSYMGDADLPGTAQVFVAPQSLGTPIAELAALLAEARGHDVRPAPDAVRFGDLRTTDCRKIHPPTDPLRIGIVVNPRRRFQVSNPDALRGFLSAAEQCGAHAETVRRATLGSVGRFDAYLIREDTSPVGGAVYRFVHAVEKSGRVSIDDFGSLIRCGNKAYQAVLFERTGVPVPRTRLWFQWDRRIEVPAQDFPLIVKTPGGAFSLEVYKCESPSELRLVCQRLFRRCPVLVVQDFVRSDFDWRIGVCNSRAIFAIRYHYPAGSWKISARDPDGRVTFGMAEPVSMERLPSAVKKSAIDAAAAIGSGLYGVDVKETPDGIFVLEVNDNPDIDGNAEASIDPESVYGTIMQTLISRAQASAGRSRDGDAA